MVLLGVLVVCAAYAYGVRRLEGTADAPSQRQRWWFAGAVLSVFVALTSPLHELSERYLFTAHMAQHLLLTLVMPPLLLTSLTPGMVRPLLRPRPVFAAARFLTHPVLTYAAANLVFLIWHLPHLYDLALRSHGVHVFSHLTFMATGVLLWWPLLSPLPEIGRVSYGLQLLYVFFQNAPGMLIGGLVANAPRPLYAFYAAAPRVVDLSATQDQQLGAIVMWVGGGFFWVGVFTVIFFRWAAKDMREGAIRPAR